MFRWHESRCSRPSIRIVGGLPYCETCDAIASTDDIEFPDDLRPPSPPIRASWQRKRLAWPAGVVWSQSDEREGAHGLGIENLDSDGLSCDKGADECSDRQASRSTKPRGCHPVLPPRSIRVLDIAPGERDDILRGNFRVVQLGTDPPHYEALSYTWADASGNSKKCRAVYIGPFWDAVPITQNCADALCSVRFHHNRLKHRTLWIDAVCVNQTDVMERTSQVALMPEIYSSAAEVLVYLGLASNSSNTALETMSRSMSTNGCRHSNGDVMCQMCQNAISQLFQRPYFKRLWVVQEIMLSRSIVIFCGAVSSSLPFSRMMELLPLDAWAVRRARTPLGSKSDLFSLMIETNHCVCQDPRDKIFALLGIPSDWSGTRILPDYSLSLDEVAIGVASYFIQVCGLGWPILMLAGQKHNEAKHLPSWVPDIETSVKSAGIRKDLCDEFLRNSHRLNQELFIVDDLFVEMDLMAEPTLSTLGFDRQSKQLRKVARLMRERPQTRPVVLATKTGFRPPPIIFESQKKGIQITSRHSHLKLVGSRLCNIHQAFDLDYMRYSHGVVVVAPALSSQPPVVSPLLFIQKLENSPTPWRVCSDFISEQDELYWLHGVEGYAILRPDSSCNMHTLVCVCDLAFTWSRSPYNLADRLTLMPMEVGVVKRVRSVLEAVIFQARDSGAYRTSHEINDEISVAKLALQLLSLLLDREHHLWREWEIWKRKWDTVLEDPSLLEHVILVLENSATTTAEEEGSHCYPSGTTQAAIKKTKSVAALLWSILPHNIDELLSINLSDRACPRRNSGWHMESTHLNLEKWAEITDILIMGVGGDESESHFIEYHELSDGSKGPDRNKWHSAWNNFRRGTGLDETIWDTNRGILYVLKLHQRFQAVWRSLSLFGHSGKAVELLADSEAWSWKDMRDRHNFRNRIMRETPETSWVFHDPTEFLFSQIKDGLNPQIQDQLRLRVKMQKFGLSWTSMVEVTIK